MPSISYSPGPMDALNGEANEWVEMLAGRACRAWWEGTRVVRDSEGDVIALRVDPRSIEFSERGLKRLSSTECCGR